MPYPQEISVVENIFSLYTERKLGAKSIAVELNGRGLRTRSGLFFSTSGILGFLTNPIYAGKVRWDGQVFPGKHKTLITEEQFAKAQDILAERRENPSLRRSNGSSYPLSGLLRCVHCRKALVGASAHGRSKVYPYYVCSEKLKSGECGLESLPKEKIETVVIDQIKNIFLNKKMIKKLLERVKAKQARNLPKRQAEVITYEKQIRHKKAIINRYLAAFESGTLSEDICGERLRNIAEELRVAEQQINQAKQDTVLIKEKPITFEDVRRAVGKLEEVMSGAGAPEQRAFLRKVIKTIKVHSINHIQAYYRISTVRIMSALAPRAGLELSGPGKHYHP